MNADRTPVADKVFQTQMARNVYRHHLMEWLRAQPNLPDEVRELVNDEAEVSRQLAAMLKGEAAQ